MHDPVLVNAVVQLAASLDRHQIKWCVLRNYECFPHPRSDTSDLDLILDCSPSIALGILNVVIEKSHISLGRIFTKSDSTLLGFFLAVEGSPAMHIDFIFTETWRGFALIAADVLIASRQIVANVPRPQKGHEAASSIMSYLFHQGNVKAEYTRRVQEQVQQDRAGFLACTTPVWGSKIAAELADRAVAGDWEWFKGWVKTAKRHLLIDSWRTPVALFSITMQLAANIGQRILNPPGLWIALLGPDGAGKTTVGAAYMARLSTLFYPALQRQLHWRPRLIPAPGRLAGAAQEPNTVTEPHSKPPHGKVLSLVRLAYFWVDYLVGHWIRVRPLVAQGGLVIFDRYYQDFLVDPRRYRLDLPAWLIRLMGHGIPQPELIFVFDAPADVLYARKQELPLAEVNAQLNALRDLAKRNVSARIIRVDRSIDEIVDEMVHETLAYLNQRNRHRLGWDEAHTQAIGADS